MKRRIVLITLALFVTTCFTVVQTVADQPVVDKQKTRQELDTMEGILSTTLGYAVKRLSGNQAAEGENVFRFARMGAGEVSGYYVYGEGAVFMIPISALQRTREMDFGFTMPDVGELVGPVVEASVAAATAAGLEAAKLASEGEAGSADAEKIKEKAEKLQQQAQERQKELSKNLEQQKQKLQQFQEQSKKRQAEMEERRKELISRLGQVKVDLKDALARYGDSLSILKPEESVTIILSDEGRHFSWGDRQDSGICEVLSVRKSLVTDLKAGKITREEFDRRVVDYSY